MSGTLPAAAPSRDAGKTGSRVLAMVAWGVLGCVTGFLLLLQAGGERWGALAVLLYLPPLIWTAPFVVLLPVVLLLRPRLMLVPVAGIAYVVFGFADFHWHLPRRAPSGGLVVMTNNVGQSNRHGPWELIAREKPDLVLLQEAPGQGRRFAQRFPHYHVAGQGEFLLLSRHLINRAQLLDTPRWHGRPVAARFEVEVGGRALALYNVHLPTPRNVLLQLLGRGLITAVLDPASDDGVRDVAPGGSLRERVRLAEALAARLRAEPLPFVVAGDFNMPSNGHVYRIFARELRDAFAACGTGFGYTFPGYTRNPASFFRPWLRLDYVFGGRGMRPCQVVTESSRPAQHRAVLARFVFEAT